MLHQCVDLANFNNIVGAITAKQTWEILEKSHSGGEKVKKVRL